METGIDGIRKLKALQDLYLKEVAELTQRLAERRARIDALAEGIRVLSAEDGKEPAPVPSAIQRYDTMSLTSAVLDIIERNGAGDGLFIPEIMERLLDGGYKTDSPNLYASTYSVAMRLVQRGKVKLGKRNGQRSFMRVMPF